MISYAGATTGQPITKEDKIIEKLSEIQQDLSTVINGLNQLDERPSGGWDQWWLDMACRATKIFKSLRRRISRQNPRTICGLYYNVKSFTR